ncbi:trypsin-like serine protease [Lactococcus insecticola]|uniref:Serine protease n=1 Tax=Pseudolactococcus insecticola TaxID=2709158 RepID=A0A6A0B7I8_9LACT|nr:trypsin-like serine protease [Lactococcus insecticola]GFH40906.1 hypothetical protein Hs20B_13040 [Lactococcus insecticola]
MAKKVKFYQFFLLVFLVLSQVLGAVSTYAFIIGSDNRRIITDYSKQPYAATVAITVRFSDGSRRSSTGVMVADDFVLTAGHVVYKSASGGFAVAAEITTGAGGSKMPGKAHAEGKSSFRVLTAYASGDHSSAHDIGGIKLDKHFNDKVGKLEFAKTVSVGEKARLSGFSHDLNGKLGTSIGRIISVSPDNIRYDMDSTASASGAGITNMKNQLLAIHSGGNNHSNVGARLAGENLKEVQSWLPKEKLNFWDRLVAFLKHLF